jgi:CheY-like chemotaxis protein
MGHKILLADDSITIQKVIELTFSDEDFELHTVGNGQKAIDEIRSIMPHIVLCDIIMPEKNGYEVCEFIKSSADLKHIPVLLLTGAFEPFDQERARNAGCDGFLAKPFEPQTLISKVKELLVRSPAPTPAPPPSAPKPFPSPAAPSPRMESDDRTLIMPPSAGGSAPQPARAPHVTAAPTPPPPAPVSDYGSGFDDAFAIEAGERELVMEPGDHTVLLGGREGRPSSPSASAGDDIWGAVETPAAPEEEDSSTVFMPPPPIAAPSPPQSFTSQDYEVQYEADDLDATWRMGNEGTADAAPPSYQGFEEFTHPPLQPIQPIQPMKEAPSYVPPPPVPEPPPIAAAPPPLEMPPPLAPEAKDPVFEPYDPFVAAAQHSAAGFEPVSPLDSDQTVDSAVTGTDDAFERISAGGFDAYGEPEIVPQAEAPRSAQPEPEPIFENVAPEPFDEIDAPVPAEVPEPRERPEDPEKTFGARHFPAASSAGAAADGGSAAVPAAMPAVPAMDDALIEKLAARVVDKLSQKILQEIAWEVVPDLAEGIIQREIDALKAKLAKVPK